MIWASRWSVALRTFYRQILSVLYSSFPFGNFRPRLVRALLVYFTQNRESTRQFKNFSYKGVQLPCQKVHLTLWIGFRLLPQTGVLRVWTVSALCFGSAFRNSCLMIAIASSTESLYINSVSIGNSISEIDFHERTGTDHCLCVHVLRSK